MEAPEIPSNPNRTDEEQSYIDYFDAMDAYGSLYDAMLHGNPKDIADATIDAFSVLNPALAL